MGFVLGYSEPRGTVPQGIPRRLEGSGTVQKDPKYIKYGVSICMASVLGIVIMAWGIYFIFGYLDPKCRGLGSCHFYKPTFLTT